MPNAMWFRSDLRVRDNPAFARAMAGGECMAVYFLCDVQWELHDVSSAKQDMIVRQLRSLARELSELNVPLRVINCGSFAMVPDALAEFVCSFGIENVYWNREYELNEKGLSAQCIDALKTVRVDAHLSDDQCAIAPGKILNQQGEMYQVFTSFKKRFFAEFDQKQRPLVAKPEKQSDTGVVSDLSALPGKSESKSESAIAKLWPEGEHEALSRLEAFLEEGLSTYKRDRDCPCLDATSRLSPYLAIGAISTSQCLNALRDLNAGVLPGEDEGSRTWATELVWRDFYRHFLNAHPQLCMHKPHKPETDRLPWSRDKDKLEAWKAGMTGFPIVDAAMRQLKSTGWMHNRLRMVVAMFLSKHLFLDWRLGERHFMRHLVDADFASNNGGWQWSASTGVDAVPYFRIFNPTRQSERFDTNGEFIRMYVKELSGLEDKSIHNPSQEQRETLGYPQPIVDHAEAVESAKMHFSRLGKN